MWPFRPKDALRTPWIEEQFQRVAVFANDLHRRITTLEQSLTSLADGILTAKAVEKRIVALEHGLRQANLSLNDDVARLTGALEVVRGQATGSRGGRPRNETLEADRQALEIGRTVIAQAATPEGRAQLILQLQNAPGAVAPQTDALGNPIRTPVRNGAV